MSIAEDLTPYFLKKEREGKNKVRYLSVKTIEFEDTYVGDINQFNVHVEYLSDQGSWKESIVVRQFGSITQYQDEIYQQKQMEKELQFHENIKILPIIFQNPAENYIVYEGGMGQSLSELNFGEELNEYILGMLCAVIQGNDVRENDLDNIKSMIEYLISISEFSEDQKSKISELVKLHYTILRHSKSGYHTLSVLDTKYIRFSLLLDKEHISKSSITNFTAFEIEILYVPPQSIINDRMMDLAMRYGEDAFEEFSSTGKIERTLRRAINFLEGYELEYEKNSYYPLEEIYEFGLTLDLQIIIVTWLYIKHLMVYSDANSTKDIIRAKAFNFIIYLLEKRPFQFYDIDPSWYNELQNRDDIT